jgi:hypothetical protein
LEGNSCLLSSGAPDSPVCHRTTTVVCPVRDFLPKWAQSTVAALDSLAHQTLFGAHRTVRCLLPTIGAATRRPQISRPTVGAGDRWLTGQSGAPPDSPVNYSHVAFVCLPRATSLPRMTHRTVRCTTGRSSDFSRTPSSNPESGEFTADQPGTPDTVRCTTGQSGVPDRAEVWLHRAKSFPFLFSFFCHCF